MKKALIPVAVLAAAGAAHAQSSVTLFGVVDAAVEHASASGPGSSSITQLTNSGLSSSRIGIRGVEDIGGGNSASFWLEGSLGNDSGAAGGAIPTGNQGVTVPAGTGLNFNRRSTVSLAGPWGEVRVGRDYAPAYLNLLAYDPFFSIGVGASMNVVGPAAYGMSPSGTAGPLVRVSNSIAYIAPENIGGFYGQGTYWMGENAHNGVATQNDGTGYGVRAGYRTGPIDVALAAARTRYAQTVTSGDFKTWNLGGSYDLRVAKLMAEYGRDSRDSVAQLKARQWTVGTTVPVGADSIRAAYSDYRLDSIAGLEPRASKIALGYVHNLSKRTALYATLARVKNNGGSTIALGGSSFGTGVVNGSSTGYDIGIRHAF
jgi:predicted porin